MNFKEAIEKARTIAIDFDGTIVTNKFPKIGEPNMNLIEDIRKWYGEGKQIIIWTCRTGKQEEECKEFLDKIGVPYNYFNCNTKECLDFYTTDCRKICADIYLDDKCVNIDDIYVQATNIVEDSVEDSKLKLDHPLGDKLASEIKHAVLDIIYNHLQNSK